MLNYHRERFRKLTFRALALRQSFLCSLRFEHMALIVLLIMLREKVFWVR